MSLEGRVAIITGAGTVGGGVGVGKAIASVLAEAGVKLVLVDINEEQVAETEALVAEKGGASEVVIGSIKEPDDCKRVVDQAVKAFGTIDILVNNAAASIPGTVMSLTEANWDLVLGVGLMGAVRMQRYAIPVMAQQKRGSIINISSIASTIGMRSAAYASMKGAVEALTRDTAVQHGRDGIRSNVILPGYLNTPRVKANSQGTAAQNIMTNQELRNAVNPLGIEGDAWDVAYAVEFLASDKARFINGVSLPVDGGVLVTSYLTMAPVVEELGLMKANR